MPIAKNLKFEEILPWFAIKGDASLYEGPSTAEFPEGTVARIIQNDQPVTVRFHWDATGLLIPFLNGKWKGQVFFEQMGGSEFDLPNDTVITSFSQVNPSHQVMTLTIPPSTIPKGVYRVVVSLTFCANDGTPGPIAAFAELGMVQVYVA